MLILKSYVRTLLSVLALLFCISRVQISTSYLIECRRDMIMKNVECPVCSGNGCDACDGTGYVEAGSQIDDAFNDDESEYSYDED